MPLVTIITPIRDRPRSFGLCARWVNEQSVDEIQWIVVDDGKDHNREAANEADVYIRREPSDLGETYAENLHAALNEVRGQYFTVVEDDDWMGPCYVENMIDLAIEYGISCRHHFPIYHLPSGRYEPEPPNLTTVLPKVSFKSLTPHFMIRTLKGMPIFRRAVEKAIRAQGRLSKTRRASRVSYCFWESVYEWRKPIGLACDRQFLSMKGIPGRSITAVHRDPEKINLLPEEDDGQRTYLRSVVGERAADLYLRTLD